MTIGLSAAARNARLDAITTQAGANALLKFYNGTRPTTGGTATTLLATLTCGATLAAASSNGVLTFNAVTAGTAAATGTATWARLTTSGGTFVADFDVGTSAPAEIVMGTTSIVSGAQVSISSGTLTEGNA
jgi:hypothetical protein